MRTSTWNEPLLSHARARGHELPASRATGRDDWAVALAFSGGGTRAAALAYGVLEELARIQVRKGERDVRLLDQVQSVSGVSGGSFTAAYYALHGERIFQDFEEKFLRRDVQGAILRRMASPQHWLPLATKRIGRSDLATALYDEELFAGATFGDLLDRPDRPDLIIHATDMVTGRPFAFTQRHFELIQSDLASIPIARAIAASSAAPVVLSPVTLRNYAAAETAERPFIHLVDGGMSDNLGLRGLLDLSAMAGGFRAALQGCHLGRARHLAVIVVNAATEHAWHWNHTEHPGVTEVLQAVSERVIRQKSAQALEDFRRELAAWQDESMATGGPERTAHLIEISFEQLADPDERWFFQNLPTSLTLPPKTVDRLREVGGRLLRHDGAFRNFRSEIAKESAADHLQLAL